MFILSFVRKNLKLRSQRHSAFRILNAVRENTIPDDPSDWILENLSNPDWEIRNVAVKLIGLCNKIEHTDKLVAFIENQKEPGFVRRNALTSLRQISPCEESVQTSVLQSLSDKYWEVRTEAALWLYHHAEPDMDVSRLLISRIYRKDPALIKCYPVFWPKRIYNEKNFEVRAAMLLALGSVIKDKSQLIALEIPLQEDLWKVRESALIGYFNASRRLGIDERVVAEKLQSFDLTCTECKPNFPIRNTFNELSEKQTLLNLEKEQ